MADTTYIISIAKSDRGKYHISTGDPLTTVCKSSAIQRETYAGWGDIATVYREFDALAYSYRCEKCWQKALHLVYPKGAK